MQNNSLIAMKTPMRKCIILLFSVCVVILSSCGVDNSFKALQKEYVALDKAVVDSMNHEIAKQALLQGEFVFKFERVSVHSWIDMQVTEDDNYIEVSDSNFYLQKAWFTSKPPVRDVGKITSLKYVTDDKKNTLTYSGFPASPCRISYVSVTLYPESNMATGTLVDKADWQGRSDLHVQGKIYPKAGTNVIHGRPSYGEEMNILNK